jgi:hypothetical protein
MDRTATESQALLLLVIRGYKEFPDQQTKNLCAPANLEVKASIQTENPSTPQLANEWESPFYAGEVFQLERDAIIIQKIFAGRSSQARYHCRAP